MSNAYNLKLNVVSSGESTLLVSKGQDHEVNVRVTIGICVKNNEATVKEAMESIIGQDFSHGLWSLLS